MTDERPVLLGFRDSTEIRGTEVSGHKRIQIFAGRNVGARGNCGAIYVRDDEWPSVRGALLLGGFEEMEPLRAEDEEPPL